MIIINNNKNKNHNRNRNHNHNHNQLVNPNEDAPGHNDLKLFKLSRVDFQIAGLEMRACPWMVYRPNGGLPGHAATAQFQLQLSS